MSKVRKEYLDVFTNKGQILYRDSSGSTGSNAALTLGNTGQVLTVVDNTTGVINWLTPYQDPLTTNGDLLIRSGGATTRLAAGTNGQILEIVSGVPAWTSSITSSDTASNVGTNGVGVFKNKTNGSFDFYKLNAASSLISISVNNTDHIDFDVNPGNINIGDLKNVSTPTLGSSQNGYVLAYNSTSTEFELTAMISNSASQIIDGSGNTSVKTAEVANTITFNANGKRIANLLSTSSAVNGEAFNFSNTNGQVVLSASDTGGTNNVVMVFVPQENGAITFGGSGPATMASDPGGNIIVKPGTATTGMGNGATTTISGGDSSDTSSIGGNLILQPGSGLSSIGQVVVPSSYSVNDQYSVVTKKYSDASKLTMGITINPNTPYTALTTDLVIIQKLTTNSSSIVNLPQGTTMLVGRYFIIKDGKGIATLNNVTIQAFTGDTIDGGASIALAYNYESVMVVWNGTEWNVI